jgi:hypothetical protein
MDAIDLAEVTLPAGKHRVRLTATASVALLNVGGMLCGQTLRAPAAPAVQPPAVSLYNQLALGL